VRDFGGRPRRAGRASSLGAIAGSLAVHAVIAICAFSVTWIVIARSMEEDAPVVALMDFRAPEFDPVADPAAEAPPQEIVAPVEAAPAISPTKVVASLDRVVEVMPEEPQAKPLGALTDAATGGPVSLAGLHSSNARRIAYVVDASGSLIGTFPAIARELGNSLARLDQRQSFAIIFFQRNDAVPVPPAMMVPATRENVERAAAWFETKIFPTGRSNPLAAIEAAMAMRPDLIFLLSAGVTGAGEYEISGPELIAAVDGLNPTTSRTGRRRVRIQCVGLLDRDPGGVLERLAQIHGGPDAYRFISRDELGLAPGPRVRGSAPVVE